MDTKYIQDALAETYYYNTDELSSMVSLLTRALDPETLWDWEALSESDVLDAVLNAQWLSYDSLRQQIDTEGSNSNTTGCARATLAAMV